VHLADELRDTGVTALALRPGVVDTPMQTYMRSLPREQVGDRFHDRFHGLHERGELLPAPTVAKWIVDTMLSGATGEIRDIRTAS
jgi:NAD(P)-dependent dehydrogenase (short-subunit alcohol dehydrogenase family)